MESEGLRGLKGAEIGLGCHLDEAGGSAATTIGFGLTLAPRPLLNPAPADCIARKAHRPPF